MMIVIYIIIQCEQICFLASCEGAFLWENPKTDL